MTRTTHRRLAATVVAVLLCTTGCGDDEEGEATPAPETEESADTGADDGAPAACEPYIDVTLAFNGEPDPDEVDALLDQLEADPPDEVAEELGTMTSAARQVLESGGEDFSAFESPEFVEAQAAVDQWAFSACDFAASAEVSAVDYAFDGIPAELGSGRVALLMTNDGTEAHEMGLLRKAEGESASWGELVALPDEELEGRVEQVGGGFAPTTGSRSLVVADLAPGEYVAICRIPVGTTSSSDGELTEGDGPPHSSEGMVTEFTVG